MLIEQFPETAGSSSLDALLISSYSNRLLNCIGNAIRMFVYLLDFAALDQKPNLWLRPRITQQHSAFPGKFLLGFTAPVSSRSGSSSNGGLCFTRRLRCACGYFVRHFFISLSGFHSPA